MSAQGGTLERLGAVRLPMWPVAALVAAMVAAAIGISMIEGPNESTLVTRVTTQERFENSAAAVREQAGSLPVVWGVSHVAPAAPSFTGFENPGAYITDAPSFATGLENPGAYGTVAWDSIGGPNEALHRQYSPPQEGVAPRAGLDPIMVNGKACMQCR